MGRNIYFTDRELSMVRDYVFEATDILGNASDTAEQVDEDMENCYFFLLVQVLYLLFLTFLNKSESIHIS